MFSRRQFLQTGAASAAILAFYGHRGWAANDGKGAILVGSKTDFVRLDLASGKRNIIATPTKVHSFVVFPEQSNLVLGLEKWGRNLSVVDFKTSSVVKSIQPSGSRNFYGHVTWTADRKHLISPQMDLKTQQGYLVWYDPETLKEVDQMEFTRGGSHDLAFLPGTDIVAVTSSGLVPEYAHPEQGPASRTAASTVAFFDVKHRKMIRQWDFHNPGSFPGHLKVGSDGRVYFVSSVFSRYTGEGQVTSGGVYDVTIDQPVREWSIPDSIKSTLKGELLSLEIDESVDRLVVTNPNSQQMLVFKLSTREFIGITHTGTTGIAWDSKHAQLYGFEPGAKTDMRDKLFGFSYQKIAAQSMSSHILFVS